MKVVDHRSSLIVVHRPAKMKILWILSALIGFTLQEKLDRIYLPPPGSKFSVGSPGDIDVPLELPKETIPSSSLDNNFVRPEIAIGIDRVGLNISPEKYGDISFDHTTSNNVYNGVGENQMLHYFNTIPENQMPDNIINTQVVKKLGDDTVHSSNGDANSIPEINLPSGDLGIFGITSTPTEIDDFLLNNNYNTYLRAPLSEFINEQDVIPISSTLRPPDNIYSKIPPQYVSTSPIGISNIPNSYHTRPENIQAQEKEAVILNYDNTIAPDGYAYSFDTSNGIHADEKGIAINGVQAVGSYSYIGDDGQVYSVNYTADENGFRPQGTHLPTAPPIPDAILKVIEQAEVDKANGIYDDGSYDENKYGYKKYNPIKNIRFLNHDNKDRESTNLDRSKSNNNLSHYSRIDEDLNKHHDIDKENKQNGLTKTKLQPFIKNDLHNESVPEISENYKSEHFVNIGSDHVDSNNNDYNKNVQNEILNSKPNLKDIEKDDRRTSIELYDKTGYYYSKPQNDYSLKVANNLINRFSQTPASIKMPGIYKIIVENTPVRSFNTPLPPNDDMFGEHGGDDKSFDIPAKFNEEKNEILSNQNTSPFPTLAETNKGFSKTDNRNIHTFNNQNKPDISASANQGYLYENANSNNDSYVPFITPTEIGLSDITSTISTAFPSRFGAISSKDTNSIIPSKHLESNLFQNQTALLNPSLDQEQYGGPLNHSNKLDNYGNIKNNNNTDFANSMSKYNMPTYGTDRDYVIEQSTARTYSEDFSGPKQAQKYDPLTGYHY